ncbi:MAG: cell division protein FtsQ/DivIB [Acetobacteraceae bacterium]
MPRVTRPVRKDAGRQPRDVARRPSGLKLMMRRQKRYIRPALWGLVGFTVVIAGTLLVHSARPGGTVARLRDALGAATNLRVQQIVVEGRSNTPELLLDAALSVRKGDPILGFSLQDARDRIETLSWVEHATVERRLPGTLVVNLTERRPFAIWQNQGKFVLIDRDGQVVANENVATFGELPLVVGAGAPESTTALLDALSAYPALKSRLVAAVRVGERRWNLQLKNGINVMLPEGAAPAALAKLMDLESTQSLLERPLAVVDMRLPDRLVVRPLASPAAPVSTGKKA